MISQQPGVDATASQTGDAVATAVEEGRRAWPDLAVEPVVFLRFLARHPAALDQQRNRWLHAADLYLACACAAGVPGAVERFVAACIDPLDSQVRSILRERDDIDEVKQILRCRLLVAAEGQEPGIATYGGRGPLRTWVRAGAIREALRICQHRNRYVDLPLDDLLAGHADPELDHLRALYTPELKRAFHAAFATLTTRERNLLRHTVVDRLRIDEIARLFAVHRVTASRWLSHARSRLVTGTRRELARQLDLSPMELSGVLRCVESKLDLSLERLLAR